jgi:hypothetical protein
MPKSQALLVTSKVINQEYTNYTNFTSMAESFILTYQRFSFSVE